MISPAVIANNLHITLMALHDVTQYWHLRGVLLNGNQHLENNAYCNNANWGL